MCRKKVFDGEMQQVLGSSSIVSMWAEKCVRKVCVGLLGQKSLDASRVYDRSGTEKCGVGRNDRVEAWPKPPAIAIALVGQS